MNYVTRLVLIIALGVTAAFPQAQTQTVTFTYPGNPVAIPIEDADVAAVAEIFVPTSLIVTNVTARVFVEYPAVGDLEISLISARGTEIVLLDNDCGNLTNVNTTFADSAPTEYEEFCPVEAGRGPFRAEESLAEAAGELSSGYWSLYVVNTESDERVGFIRDFAVTITGTPITQPSISEGLITNSASQEGGVIAPGELMSIYGVALGPEQGVTASSTPLPESLGGTTVLINGNPAPILYASNLRVDAQAPFNLTPGTVANVQVRTPTATSATIPIEVVPAFAGLYTNQTNGRGQVLAINQDGTVNSVSNPAARGSFISLYATGLGRVDPSATAGFAAPANPLLRVEGVDPAVIIGGLSAPVGYAGLAPGLVGTYQVNAQIPTGIPAGARSVILVPPNGFPSQPRVFIFVQ